MTASAQPAMSRTARLAGYLFALSAGAVWGTTGPLSTALYRAGEAITGIGFWRLLVGLAGLVLYGCLRPELFRIEPRGRAVCGARVGGLRGAGAGAAARGPSPGTAAHPGGVALRAALVPRLRARRQLPLLRRRQADRRGPHGGRRHDRAGCRQLARVDPVQSAADRTGVDRAPDGGRRCGARIPPADRDGRVGNHAAISVPRSRLGGGGTGPASRAPCPTTAAGCAARAPTAPRPENT